MSESAGIVSINVMHPLTGCHAKALDVLRKIAERVRASHVGLVGIRLYKSVDGSTLATHTGWKSKSQGDAVLRDDEFVRRFNQLRELGIQGVGMRKILAIASTLVSLASVSTLATAQTVPAPQTFSLTDTKGFVAKGATMDTAEFLGREAVRLVKQRTEGVDGFLPLPGVDFQDGTIEADVAVKITTQPGARMPGFIGIAFRARPDASSYDMFYIRPGNAQADDQAVRNHTAQYCAAPGYDWYALRRAWPWVYEGHADLRLDAWTHVKIEVAGRTAKLYLNRNPEPTLVVDGLKGLDLHGSVSLFTFVDEEGYFSNVRITHAAPKPIKNGFDAAGTWDVKLSTDAGNFDGTLQLQRDGNKLSGTWSGALGENREVKGTWRDGYVELSFTGEWPNKMIDGRPGAVTTTLAGWFDGASGKGRSKIDPRADGQWTATRKS